MQGAPNIYLQIQTIIASRSLAVITFKLNFITQFEFSPRTTSCQHLSAFPLPAVWGLMCDAV